MSLPPAKRSTLSQRILLAGPNQAGTKARKTVLEEKGHQVIVASRLKDALHHAENDAPCMAIVDFSVEHGKGLLLLDSLLEASPNLPTILLADPLQTIEADGSNCRPDLVVAKQFDEVPQLLKAVEKLSRRRVPRKKPVGIRKAATVARKHG